MTRSHSLGVNGAEPVGGMGAADALAVRRAGPPSGLAKSPGPGVSSFPMAAERPESTDHAGRRPVDPPADIAGALKADLNAQTSQSIASDLQAIRAHNEQITATTTCAGGLAGDRFTGRGQQDLVKARLLARLPASAGRRPRQARCWRKSCARLAPMRTSPGNGRPSSGQAEPGRPSGLRWRKAARWPAILGAGG